MPALPSIQPTSFPNHHRPGSSRPEMQKDEEEQRLSETDSTEKKARMN